MNNTSAALARIQAVEPESICVPPSLSASIDREQRLHPGTCAEMVANQSVSGFRYVS
jgi:hypothetical protein